MKNVGLIGSGGQSDEVEAYFSAQGYDVDFKAISHEYIDQADEKQIDIVNPTEYQKLTPVIAAVGAPQIRKELVEAWPGSNYTSVQAETSYVETGTKIGRGVVIAPRAVITTNVEIGEHVIVNVAATISHNSTLGNFVTVSPGAHIAGNVTLGDGVFVGIGAIISNGVSVSEGVVIGAGAVVVSDITTENAVVVGVPARTVKVNDGWLREV